MCSSSRSVLRNVSLAVAFGLALTASPVAADAAGASQAVRDCVRDIAAMERTAARKFKGIERKLMIGRLGNIKRTCISGKTEAAYSAAEKLRPPQQVSAAN